MLMIKIDDQVCISYSRIVFSVPEKI